MAERTFTFSRLSTHIRTPLYRNAYAWLLSTGISSGLGIVYWVLAARLYAAEAVGLNAAIVSTMILLSGLSLLDLKSALVRFIPNAGRRTASFTGYSYLVSVLLALIMSAIFIALGVWFPSLDFFKADPAFAVFFILATMGWTVFTLQDSILTGLRAAVWVPVDNISYAIAKIVLLIFLAPHLPRYGIFISWIIPLIFLLPPINLLIFQRLIPHHVQKTKDAVSPLRLRQLSKYIGSNYFASLFSLMTVRLLPVLVVAIAGATAAAYFYLAWTIANSLKVVAVNMATSLTVEGALDRSTLTATARKFLQNMFGLFVPLVVVVILAAPFLLRLSGEDYAVEGVALLRLLTISIIPGLVSTWYVSIARVRHRLVDIILAEGFSAGLLLGLGYLLLPSYGIVGLGVASLISTAAVALLLLTHLRLSVQPAGSSWWSRRIS